ncbi:hypothetical protein V2J09_021742 [Rumex salicifolius]
MVIDWRPILVFLLANFISIAIGDSNSSICIRTCGTERVSYPFGFSDGCEIRLNCSSSVTNLAGFRVHNLTSDNIIVQFPANCNRKVSEIGKFNGANYAVSWENALLLRNCSSPMNGCTIPTDVLEKRFKLHGCDSARESGNMSCFAAAEKETGILNHDNITRTCQFLISSVLVDSSKGDLDVSLQFQTIQLAWWLQGTCNCSNDADCTKVVLTDKKPRYRCSCKDGFSGDGFAGGSGCHKVSKRRLKVAVLVGGIIAGASAVGLMFLMCYFARRHSTSLRNRKSEKHLFSEVAGNSSILLYPYKEIERATNGFSEQKRLGTGAYGTVYQGFLHNNECVAIKRIKNRDTNTIEQVMNEIKLISSVSHPNLVRLLGCCIENGEQILVYEFMENGTLCQHLQRETGKVLPWTIRVAIAAETAQAIAYLHSAMNPPIYHRDIKSSNILLDYNYNSKVADFGLSRLGMAESSHISTAPQGTPGYVDPEYHQNYHLSDKSDVYSFGVLLVEIITAMKVVDFSRPHTEINLASLAVDRIGKGRLDEIIDPFLDPHRDAWTLSSIHKVAELAFRCLAYHRDMRPSMMEVAEELELLRITGCPPQDDMRSIASCCSSALNASDRSLPCVSARNGVTTQRLALDIGKDSSPISVQDPWLSANSSPSAHSLLGNVVK